MIQAGVPQEAGATAESTTPGGTKAERPPARAATALWIGSVVVPPVLYLAFVAHYGVNSLFNDDWSMVPIVDAALHGHLTWSLLFAQHNEHRVLLPNLAFIAFGKLVALNARVIMLTSAVLFVASYGLLLALIRTYAGRSFDWPFTLLLGAVWFSLSDVESALLAYQITWYFVIVFLLLLLFLMARARIGPTVLVGAALVAMAASFSSLQGLFLWAVGATCLWRRRAEIEHAGAVAILWVAAAGTTAAVYFSNFHFAQAGSGSFRYAFDHPITAVKFLLAEVGNVVPSLAPASLHWHMAIGLVLVVLAVTVLALSAREVSRDGIGARIPLPAALVVFALLFDLSSGLGRVSLGLPEALAPRYTMGNLLVVTAIAVFVRARLAALGRRGSRIAGVGRLALLVLLAAQVGISTNFGLTEAAAIQRSREIGANTLVHLDQIAPGARRTLVRQNVYFSLSGLGPLLAMAERDHLSVFAGRASADRSAPASPTETGPNRGSG